MRLIKIGFVLAVLLLAMSMASAMDYSDYAVPSMFNESAGFYCYEFDNFTFGICKYHEENGEYDFYFKNSTIYTIVHDNNMGNYTVSSIGEVGTVELVELDGEKYVVECYYSGMDDSKHKDCWDAVLEFNKQNNLKPLPING